MINSERVPIAIYWNSLCFSNIAKHKKIILIYKYYGSNIHDSRRVQETFRRFE
jgi:hypothetical protein